jgi:uncharacterized membrane protein
MSASNFFTADQKTEIVAAIKEAELNTSGEIRVHIEDRCKEDVLDHSAFIFGKLEMHKTEQRNGVLFYIAAQDHKFAILGDAGINQKVPDHFWEDIRDVLSSGFREGNHSEALAKGIRMAGIKLQEHFPYQSDDKNELSDDISYSS